MLLAKITTSWKAMIHDVVSNVEHEAEKEIFGIENIFGHKNENE